MLSADILNSDFQLNSFDVIGALSFIAGEETILAMRIKQPQRKDQLRYVATSTAVLTITLTNKDNTTQDIEMDPLTGDYSIWSTTLTAEITAAIAGGNFTFTLDLLGDGTKLLKGFVQNGLSLIVTGSCC